MICDRDTDKSRYFAITEFNNCLPFDHRVCLFVFNEYPRQAKRSVIFTQGRSQQGEKHGFLYACAEYHLQPNTSPAKMSTHALEKMSLDLFRAMSLAPRQKYPRNVVEMKEVDGSFFWQ